MVPPELTTGLVRLVRMCPVVFGRQGAAVPPVLWLQSSVPPKLTISDAERETAGPVDRRAQLITANDQVGHPIRAGSKLLTLAERQIIAAVCRQLLGTDVAVAHVRIHMAPGPIAGLVVERGCPLIVGSHSQAFVVRLSQGHLHSVEFSVLIVAVVGDALSPAAHAGLEILFVVRRCSKSSGADVVGVSAGSQRTTIVALQEAAVGYSATVTRGKCSAHTSRIPVQSLASYAVLTGQEQSRFVGVGVVAVAVTQCVGSLVADVRNRQGESRSEGTLYAQVPGVDRREVERLGASLGADLVCLCRQQAVGRHCWEDKSRRPD